MTQGNQPLSLADQSAELTQPVASDSTPDFVDKAAIPKNDFYQTRVCFSFFLPLIDNSLRGPPNA